MVLQIQPLPPAYLPANRHRTPSPPPAHQSSRRGAPSWAPTQRHMPPTTLRRTVPHSVRPTQVLGCVLACPTPRTRAPHLFTNTRPPTNHPVGALPRGRPPDALRHPPPSGGPSLTAFPPQVLRCAAVCPFPGTRTPRLFTNTRPPTNHPVGALPRSLSHKSRDFKEDHKLQRSAGLWRSECRCARYHAIRCGCYHRVWTS